MILWTIEAAVIVSAVARHWADFGIILLLLVANAVVGFWKERQKLPTLSTGVDPIHLMSSLHT